MFRFGCVRRLRCTMGRSRRRARAAPFPKATLVRSCSDVLDAGYTTVEAIVPHRRAEIRIWVC